MTLRIDAYQRPKNHPELKADKLLVPFTPLESFVRKFPHEVTNPSTLVGLAMGGLAFRAARLTFLGCAARWGGTFISTGLTGRIFSAIAGTLVEAPLFNETTRAVDRLKSGPGTSSHADPWRETAATASMLASMRTFGFAGDLALSLGRRGGLKGLAHGAAGMFISAAFQIGGLHASHQLQRRLGWIDPNAAKPGLTEDLSTLMQFSAMGMFLRGVLGEGWAAVERAADRQMEWRFQWPKIQNSWTADLAVLGPQVGSKKIWKSECEKGAWAMEGEEGASEHPAIETPKSIFSQIQREQVRTSTANFFIEVGSRGQTDAKPSLQHFLKRLEMKFREYLAGAGWDMGGEIKGVLSNILRTYPGLHWGIRKTLMGRGAKAWIQADNDGEKLWNFALLDSFDRPSLLLMTLPSGLDSAEIRVNYHKSGLPILQGSFFSAHPSIQNKLNVHPLVRFRYGGHWEEGLEFPSVQNELLQAPSFSIESTGPEGISLKVRYGVQEQKAQWEWEAPGFGPILTLKTRSEEFLPPPPPPTEMQIEIPKPPPPPPEPAPPVVEAIPTKVPEKEQPPTPLRALTDPWYRDLQALKTTGTKKKPLLLKSIYRDLRIRKATQLREIQPVILAHADQFLRIAVDGPSFLTHYAKDLPRKEKLEVTLALLPFLGESDGRLAVGAQEVIKIIHPFLEWHQREQLQKEMRNSYENKPVWNDTNSMVRQVYQHLFTDPVDKHIPPATFL